MFLGVPRGDEAKPHVTSQTLHVWHIDLPQLIGIYGTHGVARHMALNHANTVFAQVQAATPQARRVALSPSWR